MSFRPSLVRLVVLLGAAMVFAPSLVCARDSSSLPEYRPAKEVSGVIRSWGSGQMGGLMRYWEAGFRKYQPKVYF